MLEGCADEVVPIECAEEDEEPPKRCDIKEDVSEDDTDTVVRRIVRISTNTPWYTQVVSRL